MTIAAFALGFWVGIGLCALFILLVVGAVAHDERRETSPTDAEIVERLLAEIK